MYVKTGRFVYGELQPQGKRALSKVLGGDRGPEFAIEIIREYSANELVGKLLRKGHSGDWVPVDSGTLASPEWQQRFSGTSPAKFEMAGSGTWKVLHLRIESDETGPYVAIALRYSE
ncbi:MAG TPA: hypothetical protein VKM93_23240 [Terriglobia bacterium]|nr:hypothetical protein [Terriglobia bacterium]